MRPAEVCGWLRRPRRSSSASSLRTVEVETSSPLRSTSVRGEPAPGGRGGAARPAALDERARADRLAGGDVLLHYAAKDRPLALAELDGVHCLCRDFTPAARRS